MARRGRPCMEPCWLCEEYDEPYWSHCCKQREPPHQEHICRGCLDEIGDKLKLSAEIKALRTQAQAHEDKLDSLRAQMEEMKTMLKSLQGYKEDPEAADIDFDGYSRPRQLSNNWPVWPRGDVQTSPDHVQNSVRRVLCTEHF